MYLGATSAPRRVVHSPLFLPDLDGFARMNAFAAGTFGAGLPPARACVQVAALPKGARVEIDCIAVLG